MTTRGGGVRGDVDVDDENENRERLCMSVKLGAFCTCIWERTACGAWTPRRVWELDERRGAVTTAYIPRGLASESESECESASEGGK